eukprot:1110968-Rhodomonas_salina.1
MDCGRAMFELFNTWRDDAKGTATEPNFQKIWKEMHSLPSSDSTVTKDVAKVKEIQTHLQKRSNGKILTR